MIEHGEPPTNTVEHNGQGAIGPLFAAGTDRLVAESQKPIPRSGDGDHRPFLHSVAKNELLMAFSAETPAVAASPRRIRVARAGRRSCLRRRASKKPRHRRN